MSFFKLDGAKFPSIDELKEAMWPLYQDKMSKEEFDKHIDEKVEKID